MPTTTEPQLPIEPTDGRPTERVRVSSYQARIERTLTDIFFEVPTERQAGREWTLTHVAHTNGYAICELCGHNPIKKLFFIRSNSDGRELMIGSECARNYASVDLIDAYMRRIVRSQAQNRRDAQRFERAAVARARTDEIIARRAAQHAVWRTEHAALVTWLEESEFGESDRFLNSMVNSLRQCGHLTERQTETTERIWRERVEWEARRVPGGQQNAYDRAADADELPQIYNGTYTVTDRDTHEHMTFQIYTPQRGRLQGKRIVKVMRQYSRYEGFAFVGRDGNLVLWRRYADHADQPYVRWAKRLLTLLALREPGDAGDTLTVSTPTPMGPATSPELARWTIERTRSCRRCNRSLTTPTSIHAGIGPECQRQVSQETSAASQRTADAPFVVEAHIRAEVEGSPYTVRRGRTARRAAPRTVVAPGEPLLLFSELGTGEEL